jgi:peptide/nickel transport system substrate-binding protein
VREARVVNETTLDVITAHPYPTFIAQLTQFFLLPPKWATDHNPAREALGTGPYALKEWVRDDHLTLEAKSDYWGGRPPFTTVTFRPVPEASSRVSGLLAGDLDVIVGVEPSDFVRINRSGRARAGAVQSTRSAMVKFNCLKPPFDTRAVRQAMNYAVDKQGLIKSFLPTFTTPSAGQILTPAYFGFNPALKPYPYDPAQARRLLASAGVGSGFEVEFDVPIGTYLLGEELSEAIAGQLADVGVRARITQMPFSVYMDKYLKQRNMAPMIYLTLAWPTLDADGILTLFEKGNPYAYWANDEFSHLLDQARATLDRTTRLRLYARATALMREEAPVLFLFPQPATYATARTVVWRARPDDWIRAWEMTPA